MTYLLVSKLFVKQGVQYKVQTTLTNSAVNTNTVCKNIFGELYMSENLYAINVDSASTRLRRMINLLIRTLDNFFLL